MAALQQCLGHNLSPSNSPQAARRTLLAVETFVQSLWPNWRNAIRPLISAIDDLERSKVALLPEPANPAHRPSDSLTRRNAKYHIAITTEMLMNELNCSAREAAGYVAELVQNCNFKIHKNSYPTWKTIDEWRHEFQRGSRRDRKEIYRGWLALAQDRFDRKRAQFRTRIEIRDELLGQLARVISSHGK
jgi:hypothetical protein